MTAGELRDHLADVPDHALVLLVPFRGAVTLMPLAYGYETPVGKAPGRHPVAYRRRLGNLASVVLVLDGGEPQP